MVPPFLTLRQPAQHVSSHRVTGRWPLRRGGGRVGRALLNTFKQSINHIPGCGLLTREKCHIDEAFIEGKDMFEH